MQQHNTKDRVTSIIHIEGDDLEVRLNNHLDQLVESKTKEFHLGLAFDGTKRQHSCQYAPDLTRSSGVVTPKKHMIDISSKSDDEVKELLSPKSSIKRAKEMQMAVVTIQDPGPGKPVYFVFAG